MATTKKDADAFFSLSGHNQREMNTSIYPLPPLLRKGQKPEAKITSKALFFTVQSILDLSCTARQPVG